jgi:hypothetical protein
MSFKLELKGLQETLRKLEKLDDEIAKDVDAEIGASLNEWAGMMKQQVRVDKGFLKNSIQVEKKGLLKWVLGAYMPYAAYLNWGTVTRVKVSSFWANYAAMFKGKGIRKTGGIFPTFFFTGVVDREKPKLIERIKKLL